MTRATAKAAADAVAENGRRVAEINERREVEPEECPTCGALYGEMGHAPEPCLDVRPAPDMSRAVPTTVALRKAFAALPDEEKATARQAVADSLVAGGKKGEAWKAALTAPQAAPVVSEAEEQLSPDLQAAVLADDQSDRDELFQRAMERVRQGPRGKGRAVTDEELAAYVGEIRSRYPEASCRHEQQIAYWLEGIAIGSATPGSRWTRAWNAAAERLAS